MRITFGDISKRAFEIWEREGKPKGQQQEHWLRAEDELFKEAEKGQKVRKESMTKKTT